MKGFIEKFGFWILTGALGLNLYFAREAWHDVKGNIHEMRQDLKTQNASFIEIRVEQAVLKATVNEMREKLNRGR